MLLELLKDPKVVGVLITVVSNVVANAINSLASKPVDKQVQFYLHPAILILSALVAGLTALQNGTLHVDAETVKNFLTVLVTSVSLHMAVCSSKKAHIEMRAVKVTEDMLAKLRK